MVIITLNNFRVRQARLNANTIMDLPLVKTPNYTGLKDFDRFFTGYMGEYALLEYFKLEGTPVEYKPRIDGIPDDSDFIINGKKINIKTGSSSRYKMIMLPEAQFQRHRDDVYVGALLGDAFRTVELKGWITREEFETTTPLKYKVLTRCYPLHKLNPMESLMPYLTEIKQQKLF